MATSKLLMGFYSDRFGTPSHLTIGLCELTKFWLEIAHFTPLGNLFENLNPPNVNGLTSRGWNRMCHPGYFILIDVSFWFSAVVQSYLQAIFRSGRDIEGFYTEQSVMNMIKLIFVPRNNTFTIDSEITHGYKTLGNFCPLGSSNDLGNASFFKT